MSLLFVIPIALVFLIVFWRRNVSLYNQNYTDLGYFNLSVVRMYNTLHAPINYKPLEVSENFFNFTANLILKTVHFIIFSVVTYIFRDVPAVGIVLAGIYGLFVTLSWLTYKGRYTFYKEIPEDTKIAFTPIFKASICIPIYQTIISILLIMV